jgi:hypothetical protein
MDATGLIRNLTAGGVTYAMYPADNSVWVLDAKDDTVLDLLQQFARVMTGTAKGFYREYPAAAGKSVSPRGALTASSSSLTRETGCCWPAAAR